ncbi:hypothetical protein CHU95_02950 [Niveispirillum lacus]|uniref:histidine kinase n=1 Tax=Niveispirillum lacus TaxID=1981099 RepID=A0A255Z8L2_9PROT|nr:hypothetical protein [Niveispirillum lacus]OYQ36960.1 hypothetical protein CHU95_02950 [Niveispirillum lacus]
MPADQTTGIGDDKDGHGLPRGLRHDLVNALNALLGFASFLESDLPEGPQRDFARRIQDAGRQAMALAERIPSSPRAAAVRVLMVSAASDADSLILELDTYGCEVTLVPTPGRAVQVLRKAPGAWDVLLADQPGPADHAGLIEAAAGLSIIARRVDDRAATLALALRAAR